MQREDLIAQMIPPGQLHAGRTYDVIAEFDGHSLTVEGVVVRPQSHEIALRIADRSGLWQLTRAYDPSDDDDLLGHTVAELRSLWMDHRERTDGPVGPTPDLYAFATSLLRRLYELSLLRVELPAAVDPDGPCGCSAALTVHKPRRHASCFYRREV